MCVFLKMNLQHFDEHQFAIENFNYPKCSYEYRESRTILTYAPPIFVILVIDVRTSFSERSCRNLNNPKKNHANLVWQEFLELRLMRGHRLELLVSKSNGIFLIRDSGIFNVYSLRAYVCYVSILMKCLYRLTTDE